MKQVHASVGVRGLRASDEEQVGNRLLALSVEVLVKVCGSFDFVGFNHYLILRVRVFGKKDSGSGYKAS